MIRTIIAEDEKPARDRLLRILKSFPDVAVIGEAADGLTALESILEKTPDLVFLDIEMPELNGLEVARTLGLDGPRIVFITAYDEYALRAFEMNTVDYLVKPVTPARVEQTLKKIAANPAKTVGFQRALTQLMPPQKLAIRSGARYLVFDTPEISALVTNDHYVDLIIGEKTILTDDTLESLMDRLNSTNFLQVHRGAVINLRYLKHLEREGDRKYVAHLSDLQKTKVSISRERLNHIKSALGIS